MKITQVYSLMNNITKEVLGKEDVLQEDLSNIVDVGKEILGNTDIDNYVKTLADHIGKVIFDNRVYRGNVPSVLMDSWEYGSVLEKISADIPNATENKSWELQDGTSYDQQIFYKPTVSAKFYNDRVTFEIPMSFTEKQIKSSFSSAEQLNGFISMIYNSIEKSMSIKLDALIMRTINNFIGNNFVNDASELATNGTTNRCVNLLKLFNDRFNAGEGAIKLLASECITDKAFIKFASYIIGLYADRLSKMSTLFNIGGKAKFTPAENLHIVLLSEFNASAKAYLESDTYHNELIKLPNAETVPYWQGSGEDYAFEHTSFINVKLGKDESEQDITVEKYGVLGVMFDSDALGVSNLDRRVTTSYNARAEFFNNYYKMDAGYFNDFNENFVVFFVEDEEVIIKCAKPTTDTPAGEVESGVEIALTTTTNGADIYYTDDGTTPDKNAIKYTEKIAITEDVTIKAIAIKDGYDDSDVATFSYTVAE